MPGGDNVTPDVVPWIAVGGSYSGVHIAIQLFQIVYGLISTGALAAWPKSSKSLLPLQEQLTETDFCRYLEILCASYASSAVVKSVVDFWQCFEPTREYMPTNCSSDIQAVLDYVDSVFNGTNQSAIAEIKEVFELTALEHSDDVAPACEWQEGTVSDYDRLILTPSARSSWVLAAFKSYIWTEGIFYQFFDALEVKNGVPAPAAGWGPDHGLEAWGYYYTETFLSDCETMSSFRSEWGDIIRPQIAVM